MRFGDFLLILLVCVSSAMLARGGDLREYVRLFPITDGDPETQERARTNTKINSPSFKTNSLVSAGGYQFVSYYDEPGKLIVGRRKLSEATPEWELLRTEFTSLNINDSHNTSSIAVDGDGYLHVAWGVHANPLLYTRSRGPVVGSEPMELMGGDRGNQRVLQDEVPLQRERITYPQFYRVPGSGDLLLTYRTGSSGNGKFQLARWDDRSNRWHPVHASTASDPSQAQPWIDSDYEGDDAPNANAYHNGLVFDCRGILHTSWCWRTGGDSKSGFGDYQTNHHLMYAWSNDEGRTWHREDGTPYQRNGRHDIDEANAPPVVTIPEGSSLKNQVSGAAGPSGTYYVAQSWAPHATEGNHLRQYMLISYDGSQWRTHQIGGRKPEFENRPVPESKLSQVALQRPRVLVDSQEWVYVLLCDHQRGGVVTVAVSKDRSRDDWELYDLGTDNMGNWDPTCDLVRWEEEGILSLFNLPIGGEPRAPAVLEWDARQWARDSADQGATGRVDRAPARH